MNNKMADQPEKNLAPVAMAVGYPFMRVASPAYSAYPARMTKEVTTLEKINPGEHTYATALERYKTWSGKTA